MPNTRYRLKSELSNLTETKSLLTKIASNLADQDNRVVFLIGADRFNSHDCTGVLIDPLAAHDNIVFRRPGPSVSVKASKTIQGMTFTADTAGAGGNAITVALTTGATAGSEVVTVVGNAISVQVATGVSTRTQVKAALDASGPAAALIDTSVVSGATAVTAPVAPTNLTGGVTALPLEYYSIADIYEIRRLRTKKHLIHLDALASAASGD